MVVARIGVPAMAVRGSGAERLLVVPHDDGEAGLAQHLNGAVGVWPEGAQVPERHDLLRAERPGRRQGFRQGEVVGVDPSQQRDARVRSEIDHVRHDSPRATHV